jgi:hypothetical protein
MKALFLGTLAASQATPIMEFITVDVRTEILDNNEPAQAAAALADADVLLTGAWRSGFPAAPKLRLLQVPLAGTDGIDVSSLPRGVIRLSIFCVRTCRLQPSELDRLSTLVIASTTRVRAGARGEPDRARPGSVRHRPFLERADCPVDTID